MASLIKNNGNLAEEQKPLAPNSTQNLALLSQKVQALSETVDNIAADLACMNAAQAAIATDKNNTF